MNERPKPSSTGILPVKEAPHGQDGRATMRIRRGAYLPHWTRDGGFYAIAFRLHDSLPAHVVAEWKAERERLAKKRSLSVYDKKQVQKLFTERIEKYLDAGCGDCWMRKPGIAEIVANALNHFDGDRYRVLAWCVMPNHVHVVVRPNPGHELEHILHSWKSFTANKANKLLHRSGPFWRPEYYDHLIRDEDDLFHAIEYTLNNPLAAGLQNWPWTGYATDIAALLDEPSTTGILPVKETHPTPNSRTTGILPVKETESAKAPTHPHGQDGRATEHTTRKERSSNNQSVRNDSEGVDYGK